MGDTVMVNQSHGPGKQTLARSAIVTLILKILLEWKQAKRASI